jgi:FtsP/CotA-like multicopper oxidase with cupredoxin domain
MEANMSDTDKNDYSRRDFLRLGWAVASGVALPPALYGCFGGDNSDTPVPTETFVEPQVFASVNGRLELTMTVAYLKTTLDSKEVNLRSMFGSIPAPTLRVNVGDTLRILVDNRLPPNKTTGTGPVKHLRYPNSMNLHTHGLHVNPGLVSQNPLVYGDFVMDDPEFGIKPGETRQHQYAIRPDHPPGAYWYHPHLHGSTAMQIGSGMAGALLIKGAIDQVPEIAAARERVFVFHAPITDASGVLESFSQVADNGGIAAPNASVPTGEPPFLINGVRRPRLVMRTGEVQNWHFVNTAIFKFLNLSLDGHPLNIYSLDGNTRSQLKPVGPITPDPQSFKLEGIVLAPANRASVLVKAGAPGTYLLRTLNVLVGDSGKPPAPPTFITGAGLLEDVVAEVVVVDESRPMNLPLGPLPVSPALAPITDQELAAAGGLKRMIVFRSVDNPDPNASFQSLPVKLPITLPPASDIVHPGDELNDWIYQADNTTLANTVLGVGNGSTLASPNPPPVGELTEIIPFQSTRANKQIVALGSVEEWTIFNMNNIKHPFHIHINPCWVVKINDKPIDPYWADTIALPGGSPKNPGSVTFRSRFVDFKGAYVMHCHMLAHEDMGMMQTVEVV